MILIPAIDLMGGAVVRLDGGRRDAPTVLAEDPLETVEGLRGSGAVFFHFTDLDAVFGTGDNAAVLEKLAESQVGAQIGGGIRDAGSVERLLGGGADRVVIGTLFFEQPEVASDLVQRFGVRVMAALDVEQGEVQVRGWEGKSGHGLDAAVELLQGTGVRHVVYREIARDDPCRPPDLDTVARLVAQDEMAVYAHVSAEGLEAVGGLPVLSDAGLTGVILSHTEAVADLADLFAHA